MSGLFDDSETVRNYNDPFDTQVTSEELSDGSEHDKDAFRSEYMSVSQPYISKAYLSAHLNEKTRMCGYGGYIESKGRYYAFKGVVKPLDGSDDAGYAAGASDCIKKAADLGIKHLNIQYDSMYLESLSSGDLSPWNRRELDYVNTVREMKKKGMCISFTKETPAEIFLDADLFTTDKMWGVKASILSTQEAGLYQLSRTMEQKLQRIMQMKALSDIIEDDNPTYGEQQFS